MSAYILKLAFPELAATFAARVEACRDIFSFRFALAELNAFLSNLAASELQQAVAAPAPPALTEYVANYVAAMVEWACARVAIVPPVWTRSIKPLAEPYFGSALPSLRLYLLTHSPAPFRCRNLFIDSSIGAQV